MDISNFLRNATKKHGLTEGIEAGKKKVIAQMIQKGFSIQEIQKMSGLPLDYITGIEKELNADPAKDGFTDKS